MTGIIPADTIAHRLEEQKWLYPQEKTYISTDAEEYAAGDTIRMDVRIVDASTLQPSDLSRFVYVELTDPFGKTRMRVKLKTSSGVTQGYVALPSDLPEGTYTLTGYTRLMESTGPEYFFTRPVYVYGDGRVGMRPSFSFSGKGKNLRLTVDLGENATPAVIELTTPDGKGHTSLRKKTSHTFELKPEEWIKGTVLAKIGNYSLFVALPPDSTDLNVSIFPEGGTLVADVVNSVGLRVSDTNGRGVGVQGWLVDSRGDSITEIKTGTNGYGSFKFTPEPDEIYNAIIAGKEYGRLRGKENASTLQVNALRKDAINISPIGNLPQGATLLIHNRGIPVYYRKVAESSPYIFKKQDLPSGINEILLLDGDLNTISRRTVFIYPCKEHAGDIGLLLDADIPEFCIRDYGLDTSDDNARLRMDIDNIMLSSGGWQRYDVPKVIKGEYVNPSAELEVGGEISGTVKSRWRGKPLADVEVSIISSDIDYWNTVRTDSDGKFVFNGVDWPEGTRFVTKVVNSKGETEDNYSVEEDSFPKVIPIIPRFEGEIYTIKELEDSEIMSRLSKWLPEVEVTAMAKEDDADDISKIYEIIGGRTVDRDYFESRNVSTYEAAIRAFPGLIVQGGRVMYGGGGQGKTVEIWVDGVKWTPPYYENTPSISQRALASSRRMGTVSGAVNDTGKGSAMSQAAARKANIMTGGLLPSDIAMAQYAANQSPISDLAASYPFSIVDKIVYLRPGTALIVSNTAGYAGGALMIFTKTKESGRHINYDFPLKVITPLGYQE